MTGNSQMNIADEVPVACDNCDWKGTAGDTNYINDLAERLDPGTGTVPAGECPECGSLAYVKPESTEGIDAHAYLDAIHETLDGKEWSADTLDDISSLIRQAGYTIREPQ